MNKQAEVTTVQQDSQVTINISGEIDLENVTAIHEEVLAEISNSTHELVLDLSDLTYLDSSGIQMLYEIADRLNTRRQNMSLVVPADNPVSRVLKMVDIGSTVPVLETRP